MLSSTSVKIGSIEYEPTVSGPTNIHIDDKPLVDTITQYLHNSNISILAPFDKDSRNIEFAPEVEEMCIKVFDVIKQLKMKSGRELDAAYLATRLFESFTPYWIYFLSTGRDVLGIRLWKNALSITDRWEKNNKPVLIHRGTIHYFLAENYLLLGDRDLGFQYMYDALLDDMRLGPIAPSLNYPACSPSYLTITMRANTNNQLYPLVEKLRTNLNDYIVAYNQEYLRSFSISDFDNKFLDNGHLKDIVSFFVFNFLYLFESKRYGSTVDKSNEIMKLRNLDLVFNFCLIVDKTLELAEKNHGGRGGHTHSFANGIIWISAHEGWMNQTDIESLWGPNNLNLNNKDPDAVVPRLLRKNEQFRNSPIKKELHDFFLAYNFRNYAGHNIRQQNCITVNFDDIIQSLFSSLFSSIESL